MSEIHSEDLLKKESIHSEDLVEKTDIDGDILKYIEEEERLDREDLEKPEPESELEPESEEVELEESEKVKIEEFDLKNKYTHEIVGTSKLEPMVVHIKIGSKINTEKTIGVPGYYDSYSNKFFKLDGEPLECINFDQKFSHFLNSISTDIKV